MRRVQMEQEMVNLTHPAELCDPTQILIFIEKLF